MNRGVLQSSPVQQMMTTGNPNWWSINNSMRPPSNPQITTNSHPFMAPPPNNFFPQYTPPTSWHDNQDQLPAESWTLSQLLLGRLVGEEDKDGGDGQFQSKRLESWEEQLLQQQQQNSSSSVVNVKQEIPNNYVYGHHHANEDDFHIKPTWSHQIMPPVVVSSPKSSSCTVTSFNSNMLDFSTNNNKSDATRHPPPDRSSSECNSTGSGGGAVKKARVQSSSSSTTQPTFKVRKEKLGDRITALHQLVSPFGKTDTASVLLEAIGYIRFLQSQIEALSSPYLGTGSSTNMRQQQSVQGERNCIFPEDPGQLLNENCMKRKGANTEQELVEEAKKDLRSRGLCLVPVACTLQVGSDNGADYWAPAQLGGGFR